MATHSSILAWEILGQRTLAGYSPWGHKELYMTEQLSICTQCFEQLIGVYQLSGDINLLRGGK